MEVDSRNFRRATNGFGETLRELRCSRGISQLRLARMVGVHHSYLSRLERGRRGPSPGLVARLSDALQLNHDERARLAEAAGYLLPYDRGELEEIAFMLRRVLARIEEVLSVGRVTR